MDFSEALVMMKRGYRVARAGWNGKGMWICLGAGKPQLHHSHLWNEHTCNFAKTQENGVVEVLPYFIMKTADDKILMGWLASQTDLLATDWEFLP